MPQAGKVADEAARKAADEMVNRRIATRVEAELEAALKGDSMDPATQAALDAAKKEAADAKVAADKLASEAKGLRTALDAAEKTANEAKSGLDAITKQLAADKKAREDAADADLLAKAKKVAMLRAAGDAKRVTDAEVARLKALGNAGLDELIAVLGAPGQTPKPMHVAVKTAEGTDSGIVKLSNGTFVVGDWSKFPSTSELRAKNPMGVPRSA